MIATRGLGGNSAVHGIPLWEEDEWRGEGEEEDDNDEDENEDENDEIDEPVVTMDDKQQAVAMKDFNLRHVSRSYCARELLTALDVPRNRAFQPMESKYEDAIGEVFRNRFRLEEKYDPFERTPRKLPPQRKRSRRKKWDLNQSIWKPRKLFGEAMKYLPK